MGRKTQNRMFGSISSSVMMTNANVPRFGFLYHFTENSNAEKKLNFLLSIDSKRIVFKLFFFFTSEKNYWTIVKMKKWWIRFSFFFSLSVYISNTIIIHNNEVEKGEREKWATISILLKREPNCLLSHLFTISCWFPLKEKFPIYFSRIFINLCNFPVIIFYFFVIFNDFTVRIINFILSRGFHCCYCEWKLKVPSIPSDTN